MYKSNLRGNESCNALLFPVVYAFHSSSSSDNIKSSSMFIISSSKSNKSTIIIKVGIIILGLINCFENCKITFPRNEGGWNVGVGVLAVADAAADITRELKYWYGNSESPIWLSEDMVETLFK